MSKNQFPADKESIECEDGFTAMADQAPMMLWVADENKQCEWLNKAWLNYTGKSLEQDKGIGWFENIHPDDRERCLKIFYVAFDNRETFNIDYRLQRYDGTYRWMAGNGAPKYLKDGSFSGYIGGCIDIQDRKELETHSDLQTEQLASTNVALDNALREKGQLILESESDRSLYETILSTTPDFIYVIGTDHRFIYANKILLEMWGKTRDEVVGKTFTEIGYEAWHAALHDGEIDQVISTKLPIRAEVPFQGTFGRRIYDYIFAPVLNENNEVVAIAGTTRDITESNNIQEALKTSEEALQLADKRKDEFLAMLAHELRNPLAPISAAAELMRLKKLDEHQLKRTSEIITRQIKHMTGLVEDLIDVSRVTRGLIDVDKAILDIKKVIAEAVEQTGPLVEAKRHHLIVDLSPKNGEVWGDHKRLVQVVTNILSNAAKYTPAGGNILLKMCVSDFELSIQVSDNGIGIPEELLPYVYDLFTQAERTSDRSQGGLGIGLALVKSLVILHEGQVTAYSAGMGKGSTFTIHLPIVLNNYAELDARQELLHPQLKIDEFAVMIVDDNEDAAQTLGMFLEAMGYQIILAYSAESAIKQAEARVPNVFILDIGLPGMDGNELARYFKRQPQTSKIPMIALTGYGQPEDKMRTKESGFKHHLVKPADASMLLTIIEDIQKKVIKH